MSAREQLVAAVRRAIDDAERELAEMPFFVRPMVRRGFASRTGRSYDEWRRALAAPSLGAAELEPLAALAENFDGAPERARTGPAGRSDEAMRVITERCAARAAAVRALIESLRTGS